MMFPRSILIALHASSSCHGVELVDLFQRHWFNRFLGRSIPRLFSFEISDFWDKQLYKISDHGKHKL